MSRTREMKQLGIDLATIHKMQEDVQLLEQDKQELKEAYLEWDKKMVEGDYSILTVANYAKEYLQLSVAEYAAWIKE